MTPSFEDFFAALERRHRERLTFAEIRRALEALSSLYVERRGRLAEGKVFDGAGKRAAFALYYGALHFLLLREIVTSLGASQPAPRRILDLGCGTLTAGAAWASQCEPVPSLAGVDQSGFALDEARWTLRTLRLAGSVERGDLDSARLPGRDGAVLLAFAVNELPEEKRERLRTRLLAAAQTGTRVLVVEPLSRRVAPWWDGWASAFCAAGGRDDEWRFRVALPDTLTLLDRATGLDHRELTGRSLWLPGR
ncbi:MAG TPA: hypothetical protein VJU18_09525 [Vicinamibacteria bacterium]|nr:hypothetical protein [Vicinamibacteria bacterium]